MASRIPIGILFITLPAVEYGGYFLLSQLGQGNKIRTDTQRAFFRAGHAHAAVLVILAILAELIIDIGGFAPPVSTLLHYGFVLPPILIPLGFFLGAPGEDGKRKPMVNCIYVGAIVLALSTLGLGIGLIAG